MKAIVLSRKDIKEYDQIVSLYTQEKGRIDCLIRGVKKITSKNAAHIEPCSVVEAAIVPGKELAILTKAYPIKYYANIRKDFKKSLYAMYIVSLLHTIIEPGVTDNGIYTITQTYLDNLEHTSMVSTTFLDSYMATLLPYLGINPEVETCVVCEEKKPMTGFSIESGGVVCTPCTIEKKKIFENIIPWNNNMKKTLDQLGRGEWEELQHSSSNNTQVRIQALLYEFLSFHQVKSIRNWKQLDAIRT